ncbi:putative phage-type endonuclease [Tepidimonas ignava]|uniref:Phage-type endonuclease n=1 Tax=Tepidimonas ignava TaxID=114249 RepID=A0A4R3L5K7_9BURK|nr:YqaJ viral recombinase family protein [Tepidimonas ignava]TCS94080.1 putative phage-type endonuclease [Tepidimonas ignava]TSE18906.1 putative phage-type endonuclease [Tepidimonas ignava]
MPTIHNVAQGSAEWHALRARYFTASEAAAMMGCSPYETRSALLRRKASGIAEEPDAARQRLFERGHEAEAAARPIAETIIGEELYPATMTAEIEGLPLLASLDGLTMDGRIAWEHKLMSERINRALIETDLPPMDHVWQMEHQLLVSGAEEVHYWASTGQGPYAMRTYRSDPARRKALIEGWKQFQRDLNDPDMTNFRPAPEPVQAKPVPGFGALVLRVEGRVLASNLDAFRAGADAFLARFPKAAELATDQDFADAEAAAKACSEAEARIKAAKEQAIAQMADVEVVLRTADEVAETIRQARLALEKAVKARKEQVRTELIQQAAGRVREAYAALAGELGSYAPPPPATLHATLAEAIKGLKKLDSIRDRLDQAVAQQQIELAMLAERIRKGRALLEAAKAEHGALWPDAPRLAQTLDEEAIRGVIRERVAEHQERQLMREQAERERIRRAEEERQQREQAQRQTISSNPVLDGLIDVPPAPPKPKRADILSIDEINSYISPLRIDEEGLRVLCIGWPVKRDEIVRMIETLIEHLSARVTAAT